MPPNQGVSITGFNPNASEITLDMMLFMCDDVVKRCVQGGILAFLTENAQKGSLVDCQEDVPYTALTIV